MGWNHPDSEQAGLDSNPDLYLLFLWSHFASLSLTCKMVPTQGGLTG